MAKPSFFNSFSSIVGVVILIMSVFAGVLLVRQEQDIANRADELKEHKVNICHKTGSDSNPWVQIEISENAVPAHLEHGDIQGSCPETKKDDDKKDESKKDDSGTGGASLASTSVTVVNQTINPIQPTPETKYIYVTTRIDFWLKFQGIDIKKKDKSVRVIFRNEDELHVYNRVVVTADNQGIYKGTITDIRPGIYDVLIKGDAHLQKKFENITIRRGYNKYNWSKDELIAGDFDADNKLNSKDVAELLSFYKLEINPVESGFEVFDLDISGFIDTVDIRLVLDNYKHLTVEGDE